jgi:hypothetical protein
MKKAIVLLLALAVIGGAVFAEDAPYTLTGSASMTWGYDLNTENHGFTNAATASLEFPLVAEGSSTHGEEAITGSITIKDFSLAVSGTDDDFTLGGSTGSITAKILFPGDLYLQIASAPAFAINNAQSFAPWVADAFDDDNGLVAPELSPNGGFTFGMDGDFSFAFKVASSNAHDASDTSTTTVWTHHPAFIGGYAATGDEYYYLPASNEYVAYDVDTVIYDDYFTSTETESADPAANEYMLGMDVGYKLGDLANIAANVIYGNLGADASDFGFGVKVTSTPVEALDLALGFDLGMAMATTTTTGYDAMFTADYAMAELVSFGAGAYYGVADTAVDAARLDVKARLGLLAVPNLTFEAGVDLWDLMADPANDPMLILVGGKTSYKAMLSDATYVKPYAEGGYELNDKVAALSVGLEAVLFPMVTFTVDYTAGALATDAVTGGTNMGDGDKGVFTFVTEIAY